MLVTNIIAMARWERTHEALRKAALELFSNDGYDATGTAQVAERAGVSEMTLFRHFSSKEALVVADSFDPLMADAVRARPADEPLMRSLTEGIRTAWAQMEDTDFDALHRRVKIISQTPTLRGAIERGSENTITALSQALKDRGASDIPARVAAASVIAGLSAALLEWARTDQIDLDAALSSALDVLGGD